MEIRERFSLDRLLLSYGSQRIITRLEKVREEFGRWVNLRRGGRGNIVWRIGSTLLTNPSDMDGTCKLSAGEIDKTSVRFCLALC